MPIYESDPNAAPDSDFEPGTLAHLVPGNTGRVLDSRRTPVSVTEVREATGVFVVRIEGFEDVGALWEVAVEDIRHYQFALGSARASEATVHALDAARTRLDRTVDLEAPADARAATEAELRERRDHATEWLQNHSVFLREKLALPAPESRTGLPQLYDDLEAFMKHHGLADMERAFAEQFVSNPYSGEIVKGHRMVLAELGLVPYHGKVLRDPVTFEGPWSKARRREHILHRLAFVSALLPAGGKSSVTLYRGLSCAQSLEPPRNETFVSTSFARAVAEAHFDFAPDPATRLLAARSVPATRIFMTYLETRAMNRQFLEAEAVLLFTGELPF